MNKQPLIKRIRSSKKYQDQLLSVLEKQPFCLKCNLKGPLVVHHKKEINQILKEHGNPNFEEAMKIEELWFESNLQVLCNFCHINHHNKSPQ